MKRYFTRQLHLPTLLAAFLLATRVLVLSSAPAQAACAGVTVVVDFGPLGGGVQTGCAPGSPHTGLAALAATRFGYSFVPRQPGMVCQISAQPDPCNGAPRDAYWAYFYAASGGVWTYGTEGAATRRPSPGGVEGWAFGAGQPPSIAPPGASTPPTKPAAVSDPQRPGNSGSLPWGMGVAIVTALAGLGWWKAHQRRA